MQYFVEGEFVFRFWCGVDLIILISKMRRRADFFSNRGFGISEDAWRREIAAVQWLLGGGADRATRTNKSAIFANSDFLNDACRALWLLFRDLELLHSLVDHWLPQIYIWRINFVDINGDYLVFRSHKPLSKLSRRRCHFFAERDGLIVSLPLCLWRTLL